MSRLEKVVIRRFKQLEEVELDLADVTLLVGANNAGKSSVLQAIHFAVSVAQTARLVGEGVAWRSNTFELSLNPAQLLYSPVSDVLSLATGGVLQEQRASQIEVEFTDTAGERCAVGLRRGRNRNIAVSLEGRVIGERLMSLTEPFSVYAPGLAGVAKDERFLSAGVVRRFVARGDANLALRNVLRMLSESPKWGDFLGAMQTIFEDLAIEVDFDADTDEAIGVFVSVPGKPRLPLDAAGTSILQTSQILAYIFLFQPRVLILDEPDSHLHPDNQRALCELIVGLAKTQGFQAVISTHSRHVLDALASRSRLAWLSRGAKIAEPDVDTTKVLLELGALDSVDYFADGHTRCVVATEDSDTAAISALLWSSNFVEEDTEVASYAGCSKVDAAIVLGQFLADKAPHVALVVHRDRDYMSVDAASRFSSGLSAANVKAFLTKYSDVEGYFLNADHLAYLNPDLTRERIEELLRQADDETRADSLAALINQRTAEAFRARSAGGAAVNHGALAVQAGQDLDGDRVLWRRGKIVLKRLKALMQQEMGANPRIIFPSEFLAVPELQALAASIWGSLPAEGV